MRRVGVLCALILVATLAARLSALRETRSQTAPAAEITIETIRPNLHILKGAGGNSAAFVTARGVVLVDTKIPGSGHALLQRLREITDKPVTMLINTHSHFDHVGGNPELPRVEEVVAHENASNSMRDPRQPTGVSGVPTVQFSANDGRGLPTRTFRDQITLGTADDRIEVRHFGRAHTNGDAFVIFPALRAMHAGDVFPNKGIPIVDFANGGSAIAYPDALASAAKLEGIDTVITGHHPSALTMADLMLYAEFNRDFTDAVRTAKAAGRSLDQFVTSWKVPQRYRDAGYVDPPPGNSGQGTARLRMNVEILWNELN